MKNWPTFIKSSLAQVIEVSPGVKRQILAYLADLMLVKVDFDKGSVGEPHQHAHIQVTYVLSGSFAVEINGKKDILKAGDSFTVAGNLIHGVVCLEKGVLIDAFSPMRKDFISK